MSFETTLQTGANRNIVTVTELARDARRLLEGEFPNVYVEGEISNFAAPSSGHWYFTLKDDKAQLRCAMFKGRNQRIRFVPRNGNAVIVRGKVSLYEGRGEFQMIVEFMEEAGDGALRRAYEKLKADLQEEGLFDADRKKTIPHLPRHIAVITSPTGAAVRDVITVMQRRFPAVHVSVIPVQVQGDQSATQIVAALDFANRYEDDPFDVILLTRGGGSLEDLWSFNMEPVARAIALSGVPVVCAVGHESDVSIADFVADLRAPTPSAAAELITPDARAWQTNLDRLYDRLVQQMNSRIGAEQRLLEQTGKRLRHPGQRLQDLAQRLDDLELRLQAGFRYQLGQIDYSALSNRLHAAMSLKLERLDARLNAAEQGVAAQNPLQRIALTGKTTTDLGNRLARSVSQDITTRSARLSALVSRLNTLNPLNILERGYAVVKDDKGHVLTDATSLKAGDLVTARLHQGEFSATVSDKQT